MSLSLRLENKQTQGLVMTPQLQQAIKLLQLSNLELTDYVTRELCDNPFLQAAEEVEAPAVWDDSEAAEITSDAVPDPVFASADADSEDSGLAEERLPGLDVADEAAPGLRLTETPIVSRESSGLDSETPDLLARLTRPPRLRDRLYEQLCLAVPPGEPRQIGIELIEALDDAGYLTTPLTTIAQENFWSLAEVEAVLALCQSFSPTGIFARDVGECLALQLRERNRLDPAMQCLIDHLPLLAKAEFATLQRRCEVSREDLLDMIDEIKALDPRPGLEADSAASIAVIPDILVSTLPSGDVRIELNSATLPRVIVNADYYASVVGPNVLPRDKEYVTERFQSANWLVKALDQRARTLLKVAEAVVARQLGFFQQGISQLKPLVLRDIAEATGLHESTVSRATAGKYLATPRGNLPFKFFFTTGLPAAEDGREQHSAAAIRARIKALIDNEPQDSVLSDDQIVGLLKGEGVAIARRTVAKYRETLGIASSVRRRQQKALRR